MIALLGGLRVILTVLRRNNYNCYLFKKRLKVACLLRRNNCVTKIFTKRAMRMVGRALKRVKTRSGASRLPGTAIVAMTATVIKMTNTMTVRTAQSPR